MATNQEAVEREKKEKVDYDWGTLWPHYHKEKMNWATGFRTKGDVDIPVSYTHLTMPTNRIV